jgi:hypothetical protein
MPGSVSLTGKDVVTLNGRVFHDFGNGDVAKLSFEADLINVMAAKDGNVIYALNTAGFVASLELILLAGGSDDKYLNSLLSSQSGDLSSFVLIAGAFVKRVGDGSGKVTNVIYNTFGGIIERFPDAKINTTGDTMQSQAVWRLKFGQNSRAIM